MKELEECLEALLAEVKPIEKTEYVALTDACDRILGEDIVAQMMIPPYPKSAMDGYAVRAEDTSGADREHPVTLQIVGELFAGDCAEMECASIAHAAYVNNIPCLIIRAISDKADGSAEMDYPTFEKKAAANSIKILKQLIKNL